MSSLLLSVSSSGTAFSICIMCLNVSTDVEVTSELVTDFTLRAKRDALL